jgi:hypothetical protein
MNWPTATVLSAAILGAAVLFAGADMSSNAAASGVGDAIADGGRQQGHPIGNFALAWQASDGAVRLCRADLSGKEFAALECTDWVR